MTYTSCPHCGGSLLPADSPDAKRALAILTPLDLSDGQRALAKYLARAFGQPRTKEALHAALYGSRSDEGSERGLYSMVKHLRYKLVGTPLKIASNRGRGDSGWKMVWRDGARPT